LAPPRKPRRCSRRLAALKADEAGAPAKFNAGDGGFRDRDLYVFCYDMATGNFTAHVNKALLGTDIRR
jgi:cytochrome c